MLKHYTPVKSYYKLAKTVEGDPEFDVLKARKKLRRYVEGHEHAIRLKAEIMVDHFHEQVFAQRKIDGTARAMVITNGIERAIQYYHAIREYLKERKSPYQAIVAFSGEKNYAGEMVTEATLNGFPSAKIAEAFQEDPYRFLVCADKFQTGYDEPLLHTLYVDKPLSGVKAVQALSRLNRAHPKKHDVFVLDFLNDTDTITEAFSNYYRTTILADETDPNKLHDLQSDLGRRAGVLARPGQGVREAVPGRRGSRPARSNPRPVRGGLHQANWTRTSRLRSRAEPRRSCALTPSSPRSFPTTTRAGRSAPSSSTSSSRSCPRPVDPDLSKGILETIDMDSYRVEKRAMQQIILEDEDSEIGPVPTGQPGGMREIEIDRLSAIIADFNDLFGGIDWQDNDRVHQMITETIPAMVAEDTAFKNARANSDRENARIEHDRALGRVMMGIMKDDTELFKPVRG